MPNRVCGLMPYVLPVALACAACSGVDSDEQAHRAFLALDQSIVRTLNLAFQGFNMATNTTIAPQTAEGNHGGTLTVDGTIEQSAAMKTLRLDVAMVGYDDGDVLFNDSDTVHVKFDTATDATMLPHLDLALTTNAFSGTLDANASMTGLYQLRGDLTGTLALDVMISGYTMVGNGTERVPGSTQIVGTATNGDGGVFEINITR
ncbi:MAG TPA: hypothetical protein VFV99_07095 [Kofleriaceae bacterium]|nr:hypothetical protein [Kofleriaceae bacterium]